jgi:hypothetical protein
MGGFIKYVIEMASGGMICIPSFMMTSSGIPVILTTVPQQFEGLQCWYYWWEGFMKYATEMVSRVMIYLPSFKKIGSGVQKLLRGTHTYWQQDDLISSVYFSKVG